MTAKRHLSESRNFIKQFRLQNDITTHHGTLSWEWRTGAGKREGTGRSRKTVYIFQLNQGTWSTGHLKVCVQINANQSKHFTSSRYTEQGRRNTWHLFPGHVAGGVLGNWYWAVAFWKSASVLEDSLSLKKSKETGFHTAQASQHNNYTKQSDNKIKDWEQQKEPFPKVQLMHLAKHQQCGSLPWEVFAYGQRASHQGTSAAVGRGNTELILTGKF